MFAWLFKKRNRLTAVEKQVIDSLAKALEPDASELLCSQVDLIEKIQRIDADREVDFYYKDNSTSGFPENLLFPNRSEELALGQVLIKDPETGHQSNAAIYLVKGRLFSIEFSHTPRDLRGAPKLETEVELVADPMMKTSS